LERVFLLVRFVLAMIDILYCNDTTNRYDIILNYNLVVVDVVMVEFYFPIKNSKTLYNI